MVDARLPAEWLGSIRIDDLSDRAFRTLACALLWCNEHGTDGLIPARYTRYLHPDGDHQIAFEELEDAGFWVRAADGFHLIGWSEELHQSTAAELRHYRESSRQRQRAYRERKRKPSSNPMSASADLRDVVHEETRFVTRDAMAHLVSGSGDLKKKRAATARDVARDVESPFCRDHPTGTTEPCGACARARVALAARRSTLPGLGWDCTVDGHKLLRDDTCAVCDRRPEPPAE